MSMGRGLVAALAGVIFGLGLGISRMLDPAKVLGFLDLAGSWDPSLALVFAGAVAVGLVGYRLVLRRSHPVLAESFELPAKRAIEPRLIGGAALFGVGWGLVGFGPGPAIAALAHGRPETVLFVSAMVLGMAMANVLSETRGPYARLRA